MIDIIIETLIEVYDQIVFEALFDETIAIITPFFRQFFDTIFGPLFRQ